MQNPKQLNPVTLAFLGDAVYEARVRTAIITRHHSLSPGKLHYLCVQYVKAEGQYQALQAIQPLLSEEEQAITAEELPPKMPMCAPTGMPPGWRRCLAICT